MLKAEELLWIAAVVIETYILARALLAHEFKKYLSLNLFVALLECRAVVVWAVYSRFGLNSVEYQYVYYYSDALLTVAMYLVIMHLYQWVFMQMRVGRYIRSFSGILLALTALFSYFVVQRNSDHLTSRFVVELSQNLYFVGLVLTYLLWAAVFKLHETRARVVQLVLALGAYFSATAALYAFWNLFPSANAVLRPLIQLAGTLLPLAWAYTFTWVPEDARLARGHLLGLGAVSRS